MLYNKMFVIKWIYYEIKYVLRNTKYRLKSKIDKIAHRGVKEEKLSKYCGKQVLSIPDTNQMIYDKIMKAEPFFVGRVGGNEMNMVAYCMRNALFPFRTDARKDVLHDLYFGAGFFPEKLELGEKFAELMRECTKEIDLMGVWNRYMEEWLLAQYAPKAHVTHIEYLQPWNMEGQETDALPWTMALEGKKVLVIHPFSESITEQYEKNRMNIFRDLSLKCLLPEFDLITLKSVQSMGNCNTEFSDWFEALDYMVRKCKEIDFDVAIIGCGAYGFPLAAEIKKMGKAAIHLGGVTQLLFGIRGKRWDDYDGVYHKMMNDYWVRPKKEECIDDAKQIENACYW